MDEATPGIGDKEKALSNCRPATSGGRESLAPVQTMCTPYGGATWDSQVAGVLAVRCEEPLSICGNGRDSGSSPQTKGKSQSATEVTSAINSSRSLVRAQKLMVNGKEVSGNAQIEFGARHRGESFRSVFQNCPEYVRWAHETVRTFKETQLCKEYYAHLEETQGRPTATAASSSAGPTQAFSHENVKEAYRQGMAAAKTKLISAPGKTKGQRKPRKPATTYNIGSDLSEVEEVSDEDMKIL